MNLLQRHSLRFWNPGLYTDELENHHESEEREYVAGREGRTHPGEERGDECGEDPVCETAEGLAFRALPVGKYLGYENPDVCSLTDSVRGNEGEDTNRHD